MKTNKLLYGFFAFMPLVGLVLVFVFMGMMFSTMLSGLDYQYLEHELDMPYYLETMVTAMVTGVVSLVGVIMFVLHCLNNIHITSDKRTLWMVILVLAGTVGMILYYFTWIRKEDELNAQNPVQF